MSNNKTEKEIVEQEAFRLYPEPNTIHEGFTRHENRINRKIFIEGAEFASSRLATLQAENEKLRALLENEVRGRFRDHNNQFGHLDIDGSREDSQWQQFQQTHSILKQ